MKKSTAVRLPLIALLVGTGGVGIAGALGGNQTNRDCVDKSTGAVANASLCDSAYNHGYYGGNYLYRYSNGNGITSLVDPADHSSVSSHSSSGFGSSAGDGAGGHSSGS
jgi:hypothetical protein